MFVLEAIVGMLGMMMSGLTLAAVFLGIPWALYVLAHMKRTTDETLRVQREILREIRRSAGMGDSAAPDETAGPPKQPFW